MNRGSWLLAFGLSSLVGALFAPGCSSSSSGDNTSPTTDGGGKDGTTADSSSGGGEGGSSGADSSSSGGEGGSSGADSSSGGGEAGSCTLQGADPATQACINAHCCSQIGACVNDPKCLHAFDCTVACVVADGGTVGTCGQQCAADAGVTGATELLSAGQCLGQYCSAPTDAGGGG
jgi:hypothetical protein